MIPPLVHMDCYEPFMRQMKDPSVSSYKVNENAPVLTVDRIRFFIGMLFSEAPKADDLRGNPGLAPDEELKKLPPTTFGVTGLDPIRDEGEWSEVVRFRRA